MTSLIRSTVPAQADVQHALVQRFDSVIMARMATEWAMDELGQLYCAAALDTDYALRRVQASVNIATAVHTLTPAQQTALEQRTQQFLNEMLATTEEAGAELMNALGMKTKKA
jgi:hypothetical protein